MGNRLVFTLLSAWWLACQSAMGADLLPGDRPDITAAKPGGDNAELERLARKAAREGSVRILVVLDQDEDDARTENLEAQDARSKRIRERQNALLKDVPIGRTRSIKRFQNLPFLAMAVDQTELRRLSALPQKPQVFEDRIHFLMGDARAVAQIGADAGWAAGHTGAGQSIVILDGGVDKNHPLLQNKVVGEACYSTRDPLRRIFPLCGGRRRTAKFGLNSAHVSCGIDDLECMHGTVLASLAAGNSLAPDLAGSGVAPHANIIAIKVTSLINSRRVCGPALRCLIAQESDILRGLDLVFAWRSLNIAAVNISLGGNVGPRRCNITPLRKAVARLRSANIATVAASGNDGSVNSLRSPACVPGVVSVGATDTLDEVWPLSNNAAALSLLAPGVDIHVPMPGGFAVVGAGTSFSAPLVAGAWATLKARKPSANVDEILAILAGTGRPLYDPRNGFVKPRIQIGQAHASF